MSEVEMVENATAFGELSVYDPDGDPLIASLTDCNSVSGSPAFTLTSGEVWLTTVTTPPAGSASPYTFRVTAAPDYSRASNTLSPRRCDASVIVSEDSSGFSRAAAITITNTDRPPVVTATCPGPKSETATDIRITYTTSDPDGDAVVITAGFTGQDGADVIALTPDLVNSRYLITGSYNLVAHAGPYSGTTAKLWYRDLNVTVTATSGLVGNLKTAVGTCTFRLNDVDRAPVFISTPENGLVSGTTGNHLNSCGSSVPSNSSYLTAGAAADPDGNDAVVYTYDDNLDLTCTAGSISAASGSASGGATSAICVTQFASAGSWLDYSTEYYYDKYKFKKPIFATANGLTTTGYSIYRCYKKVDYTIYSIPANFWSPGSAASCSGTYAGFSSGNCSNVSDCDTKTKATANRYPVTSGSVQCTTKN